MTRRPGTPADAVDGVVPREVVEAATVDDVQAVVREGRPLVASGLGAHLAVGAPPAQLDVLLKLDALARIVDHQAADMTVTVQAGCPLATLQAALAGARQWLPLDPPGATTVGGLIAANLSGPLRASQGTVRDLLLGLTVVGADGALVRGGGKVVKNVAGYDLPKLHVGALGTLGVIVEATFKVRPTPAEERAVVIARRTAADAARVAQEILDGPVPPLWLEVAGAGGLAEGPGTGAAAIVGWGGTREEVEHALSTAPIGEVAHHDVAALRARIAAFPIGPAAAVLRASCLPSEVGALMTAAEHAGGPIVRTLAHAANGVVHIAVADAARVPSILDTLRAVHPVVVERATGAVKRTVNVWGDPGPSFPLMQRLKAAFDPDRMFAPARFVGGL